MKCFIGKRVPTFWKPETGNLQPATSISVPNMLLISMIFRLPSIPKLTHMNRQRLIALFSLLFICSFVTAQDKKDKKWDVSNPEGPYKEVSFTTTEGTWMNVDLSPEKKSSSTCSVISI